MPRRFTEYQKEIAFDRYYSMGAERDLKRLCGILEGAKEFPNGAPAYKTIKKWSAARDWFENCKQRDRDNAKKAQAKTDTVIVNTKADYRKDVKLALQPVKAAINKAIVKNEKTGLMEVRIPIAEAKDLSSVISSFVNLIKMDLLLMGEADSRTDHRVALIDLLKEAREGNDDS